MTSGPEGIYCVEDKIALHSGGPSIVFQSESRERGSSGTFDSIQKGRPAAQHCDDILLMSR